MMRFYFEDLSFRHIVKKDFYIEKFDKTLIYINYNDLEYNLKPSLISTLVEFYVNKDLKNMSGLLFFECETEEEYKELELKYTLFLLSN